MNGSSIAEPTYLTFAGLNFALNTADPLNMGEYLVTVTATVPQPSDPNGSISVATSFIV